RVGVMANMLLVTGPLPGMEKRVDPEMRVLDESDEGAYRRQRIDFLVETGDRLPAYLCIPKHLSKPFPAMLCLHPTGADGKKIVVGRSDRENRHYAGGLARRGYVALSPDCVNMGD